MTRMVMTIQNPCCEMCTTRWRDKNVACGQVGRSAPDSENLRKIARKTEKWDCSAHRIRGTRESQSEGQPAHLNRGMAMPRIRGQRSDRRRLLFHNSSPIVSDLGSTVARYRFGSNRQSSSGTPVGPDCTLTTNSKSANTPLSTI